MKNCRYLISILASLFTATASAQDATVDPAKMLSVEHFEETGKRRMCINYSDVEMFFPLDKRHLFFETKDKTQYINRALSVCENIMLEDAIAQFLMRTGKICRNTRIDVVKETTGGRIGTCALSDFKEVRLKDDIYIMPID